MGSPGKRGSQVTLPPPSGRLEGVVAETFGALLAEFDFRKASGSELAPEAWVTYHNGTTAITVHEEIGAEPWVKISRLDCSSGRLVEGEGYSLSHVLSLRAPTSEVSNQAGDEGALRDKLAEQAALVSKYCGDMLRGDFRAFPELREVAQRQLQSTSEESSDSSR